MMRNLSLIAGLVLLLNSCAGHFITDEAFREKVASDFALRESVLDAASVDLDAIRMSADEREALEFLYAYMPVSDVADYSPDYFLMNVDYSLKAREEMPWGSKVPDREFLHFARETFGKVVGVIAI